MCLSEVGQGRQARSPSHQLKQMFTYTTSGIDLTQAFIALSRRVSVASAYFSSGDQLKGLEQMAEAMEIIERVERAKVSTPFQNTAE